MKRYRIRTSTLMLMGFAIVVAFVTIIVILRFRIVLERAIRNDRSIVVTERTFRASPGVPH